MKLHDLRPADGSRKPRTRVGRGIAAGKGKTAGRGTKGQLARTGHGSSQPWFEGGQTAIHVRIPKLRGFRNPFRVDYEIVNVGRLSALAETGVLDAPEVAAAADAPAAKAAKGKAAPVTINQDILAAVGLVRSLDKPLKVLGQGDVSRPMFVLADAFSKSAAAKIEAAGGRAQVLEYPGAPAAGEAGAETAAPSEGEAPKPARAPRKVEAAKPAEADEQAPVTPETSDTASDEAPESETEKDS